MDNLQQLQSFLLLVELKAFNKVAKKINLSTTAISKHIKALETSLNEQLFIRSTRHLELTEFGKSFYKHCQELSAKIMEVQEFVASKKETPQGKLTIICALTTGKDLLLRYLPQFCALYPHINISIEFTEDTMGVQHPYADIHFAYSIHPGVTDDMYSRKLFSINHLLCASPGYLKKYPPIKVVKDLMKHKLMTLNIRDPLDSFVLANDKKIQLPYPYLITNNFDTLIQLALDDMGILLIADQYIKTYLSEDRLVKILSDLPYRCFDIYIFYRAMKYELPKVKAFVDFYSQKILEKQI